MMVMVIEETKSEDQVLQLGKEVREKQNRMEILHRVLVLVIKTP
jgi:hypothetical protein